MNEQNWRKERDDRSLRYAGRVLNPEHWITLRADSGYAERYDGQVAILTAANLFGRMSPAVALDIPSLPVVAPLSWVGSTLPETVLDLLRRVDLMENSVTDQRETMIMLSTWARPARLTWYTGQAGTFTAVQVHRP